MKIKIILVSAIISILLLACKAQKNDQKNELVQQLIRTTKAASATPSQKIVILKTEHCEDFDCEAYFQEYQAEIRFYSREDAFMRGISDYLEIKNIDEANGQIKLRKRKGAQFEDIEIKL